MKTANGLNITVKHAVSTPHPYSRINLIAGTKGIFRGLSSAIYSRWNEQGQASARSMPGNTTEHPLWKREGEIAQKVGGHGGMDFIMIYRLLQCLRERLATRHGCIRRSRMVVRRSPERRVSQPAAAPRSKCRTSRVASGNPAKSRRSQPRPERKIRLRLTRIASLSSER